MLNSKNLLTTRNMPASNLIAPVKSLLIAKQAPVGISAYHELGKKYGLQVEFMRLTSVIPMSIDEFKHHRLLISQCDSLIFNSSHVVDHFFQLPPCRKSQNAYKYALLLQLPSCCCTPQKVPA